MSAFVEAVISRRVAEAVTAAPRRSRLTAQTARAWIDTLSARAQLRCERRIRPQTAMTWTSR